MSLDEFEANLKARQRDCKHFNFRVFAEVGRLTESESDPTVIAFTCGLSVFCADCGLQFEFVGLPLGFSHYQPTVSMDGKKAEIPITIPGVSPREGLQPRRRYAMSERMKPKFVSMPTHVKGWMGVDKDGNLCKSNTRKGCPVVYYTKREVPAGLSPRRVMVTVEYAE